KAGGQRGGKGGGRRGRGLSKKKKRYRRGRTLRTDSHVPVSRWRGGPFHPVLDCFFSSRRRHTRLVSDWSSDVCSSDLMMQRLSIARAMMHDPEVLFLD